MQVLQDLLHVLLPMLVVVAIISSFKFYCMFYFTCDRSFIYCIYCTEYGASKPRVRGAIANHDDDDDDDELEYQAHLGPTACDNSPTTSRYCEHSSHLIGHQ